MNSEVINGCLTIVWNHSAAVSLQNEMTAVPQLIVTPVRIKTNLMNQNESWDAEAKNLPFGA